MNLDEFVSETLKAIIKGVKESQDFAKENGARVNPTRVSSDPVSGVYYYKEEGLRVTTNIEFDVAVTASTSKESGVNAGIKVWAANLGGKINDTDSHETISRVKFHISVALPSVTP